MAPRILTGACLCRKVTYEVTLPANEPNPKVILCHCTSCKRYTGSGFSANIMIPKSSLRYTSGTPKLFLDPSSDRGGELPRYFCGDCGTPFVSEPRGSGDTIALKSGTLDEEHRRACGELALEIFCRRRDAWVGALGDENVQRIPGTM